MASNFKIFTHRGNDALHLKLAGDFDGSSACELFNVLKENGNSACRIIIHTNDLKSVIPFGREIFKKNLGYLNGMSRRLHFQGKNSYLIFPENNSAKSMPHHSFRPALENRRETQLNKSDVTTL